ncbi:MAG: hypothetical protein Q4D02_02655 [Clostridia bacterium]|nr:hypothetical protein [Clostridia bacterium]
MTDYNTEQKIRRIAFRVEKKKVVGVDFFVNPVKKHKDILRLLKQEIGNRKTLEVSSFSDVELGRKMSAFQIPYEETCLECVFQAAKVFEKGGPYLEWLNMPPAEVKRDPKKKESGKVIHYIFHDEVWSTEPKTAFYDYLYIDAAKRILTKEELEEIMEYELFTDVALNPEVSTNCQARTMALIQLMLKEYGKILEFPSKEEFITFHRQHVMY